MQVLVTLTLVRNKAYCILRTSDACDNVGFLRRQAHVYVRIMAPRNAPTTVLLNYLYGAHELQGSK